MTVVATMTLYPWLRFLHAMAAMVWVGGGIMLAAVAARELRDPDPAAVARFTASLRVLGPLVLAPAMVAGLGLGIWLVAISGAWNLGQLWVQLGLGLFVAAFVIAAAFQSRTALAAAAQRGDDAEARRQLTRWLWGYRLIILLLVIAVWDMTTKPGL